MKKFQFFILFLLISTYPAGCTHVNTAAIPEARLAENYSGNFKSSNDEYTLQAGDVMDIKFYYNPELNELLPIRPDGKISLQLIDEVDAAGLQPSELERVLTEKYSVIFHQPEIAVIVKEFAGQKVYVGGEVISPSVIPVNRNTTVLQAILNAGGFKESAALESIIIISRGAENQPVVRKVNLGKALSGESPGNDIFLMPFDIVYIPKSFIANANKFVDQYINKIVPDFITAGFSYSIFRGIQTGTD